MGPILPLAALAAAALIMGSGKGGASPGGVAPPAKDPTRDFIDTHSNPADLYAAAKQAYAEGRTVDAASLLGAANTKRTETGLAPLPYPPVDDLKAPAKPSTPAAPTQGGHVQSPVLPPLVNLPPSPSTSPGGRPPPPGGLPPAGSLPQSPLHSINIPNLQGAAEDAIKSEIVKAVQNAADLGPLGSTIAVASANIIATLLKGGDGALGQALSVALAGVATGVCAATPAAPLAPLCGAVGVFVGKTMGTGLGLKKEVQNPLDTQSQRFSTIYNALLAQVPDDRKSGLTGQSSLYNRISAQLAVTCWLYVYRQNWGPTDPYGDTLDWGDGYAWNTLAGPAKQLEQWNDLCNKCPIAFGFPGEPLAEFMVGRCAAPSFAIPGCDPTPTLAKLACREARRKLWRFGWEFHGQGGALIDGPGSKAWDAFEVAVSRILLVCKTEAETRFARDVLALKDKMLLRVSPICLTIKPLEKAIATLGVVEAEARSIAYNALAASRGLQLELGTPTEIAERGLQKLKNMAVSAGGHIALPEVCHNPFDWKTHHEPPRRLRAEPRRLRRSRHPATSFPPSRGRLAGWEDLEWYPLRQHAQGTNQGSHAGHLAGGYRLHCRSSHGLSVRKGG